MTGAARTTCTLHATMGVHHSLVASARTLLRLVLLVSLAFTTATAALPNLPNESGQWTRLDERTVALTGNIDSGSLFKFELVFDDEVETVVLNSGGGYTHEALQIGRVLKVAKVDVVVDGICLSSCANYLFTAGRRKTIRDGVVGFHGNTRASVGREGVDAFIEDLPSELGEAEREAYRAELEQTLVWEHAFFADLGIDQTLFERTQRADKGMDDGEVYAFLLPTPATFERYGIRNVNGKQSMAVKRAVEEDLSMPLTVD